MQLYPFILLSLYQNVSRRVIGIDVRIGDAYRRLCSAMEMMIVGMRLMSIRLLIDNPTIARIGYELVGLYNLHSYKLYNCTLY